MYEANSEYLEFLMQGIFTSFGANGQFFCKNIVNCDQK